MKAHSWTRKNDTRLINPEVIETIDEYVPTIEGWEISQQDNDPLTRQFKIETSNPEIKAVVNVYSNGTVHISCSPKIHGNEFDVIVDKFKRLCDGVESYLKKGKRSTDKFSIPGVV